MKYKVEDTLEKILDYRGKTPKKSNNGIPVISAKCIKNGRIDYSSCYFISSGEYGKFMTRGFPRKGDIILTTEAPLGNVAKLNREDIGVAQRVLTLCGKAGVLDNDYLLYFLKSGEGQNLLKSRESGTTVTGIKQSEFRKLEIDLPPISIQKRMVKILLLLDQKIDINTRINKNLLDLARRLFDQEYQKARKVVPFTDLIQINGGGTPKTGVKDYWGGSIPFFTPKDVGDPIALETEKYITEPGLAKCNSRLYPKGTTFVTARGTVGKLGLAGVPMAVNQSCYALTSEIIPSSLIYFFAEKTIKSLRKKANGAVFNAIVMRDFNPERVKEINPTVLSKLSEVIRPLIDIMIINEEENIQLANIRDSLLPKLLSGEIKLS
ncbi:restriction endonuclease subunit S [Faecalibaculum rodentium]|uniref:restriction endonuclease subunit S n=1 Tax=Faecalibaculum rodentium TaxID=1702221 RepID=UPI0023F24FA0|nr:restriction endonuclease subunit S [Faecalibaculum rodentium]